MTRETKIGLLVGLGFIIVVGVLLSDHISSAAQPPPPALVMTGQVVRQSYQVAGDLPAPLNTRDDLTPRTPATRPAEVRAAGGAAADAGRTAGGSAPLVIVGHSGQSRELGGSAEVTRSGLAEIARSHGETIEPVGPRGAAAGGTAAGVAPAGGSAADALPMVTVKEHVANPGDSVSRIAAQYYGRATPANTKAIIRANPSLAANPHLIVVGQKYFVPLPTPAAVPAPVAPSAAAPIALAVAAPPAAAPTAAEPRYTVKPGDSLWRIATQEVGDSRAVSAIRELNADVIRGDVVRPGMVIKLPRQRVR